MHLIGTLAFLQLLGFSINILTLFALVLAIGIVVDNAIVVVEAVHVKMVNEGFDATEATIAAMKEISGAIVAITLVMSQCLCRLPFFRVRWACFYRQISLTLAIAIVISGVNALTLTPALCAIMLKHDHGNRKKTAFDKFFALKLNKGYNKTENKFGSLVGKIAVKKPVTIAMLLFFIVATWGANAVLPSGFIPTEDQGTDLVNVTTPAGSTVERTEKVLDQLQTVTQQVKSVENVSTLAGYSLMSDISGASYGMAMINLAPWQDREKSVPKLIEELKSKNKTYSRRFHRILCSANRSRLRKCQRFRAEIAGQEQGKRPQPNGGSHTKIYGGLQHIKCFPAHLRAFDPNFPQYLIHLDQEMAAQKG